jgi:hypothetical protein
VTSHVGWDTVDLPSKGKKLRVSMPTHPRFFPRRSACGASNCASVLPHPSGWHALRAGAWHEEEEVCAGNAACSVFQSPSSNLVQLGERVFLCFM